MITLVIRGSQVRIHQARDQCDSDAVAEAGITCPIRADGEYEDRSQPVPATILRESTGPTDWRQILGSEALSERFDQIR